MPEFKAIKSWTPGYLNVCPHHLDIMVKCGGCGKEHSFERTSVPGRLRHALITDIEPKLKCLSCGEKNARLLFGYWIDM